MKTENVLAFIGGAIAGAAVALLLAPEKGEVTRGKIKDAVDEKMDKYRDALDEKVEKYRGALERKFCRDTEEEEML